MRNALLAIVLAVLLTPAAALGETKIVKVMVPAGALVEYVVECPPGQIAVERGFVSYVSDDADISVVSSHLIDATGETIFRNDPVTTAATRARFVLRSVSTTAIEVTLTLQCKPGAATTPTTESKATIQAGKTGGALAACPAGQVPVGAITNANGVDLVLETMFHFFGTLPNVTPLHLMPIATRETAAPSGIAAGVRSLSTSDRVLRLIALCAHIPGARALLANVVTNPNRTFELKADVPDGHTVHGFTALAGTDARLTDVVFRREGGGMSYDGTVDTFAATDVLARGINTSASNLAPKAAGRAFLGVVVTPPASPPPAPTVVTVVEFFHAVLDHYFITASAKEISDLDTGVHPGWQRTNQTFKAYAPGSTGTPGRRPVCREYGNPAAKLDSHFYSASPFECIDTLAKFGSDWLLESSEVFQLELPDQVTGACPAGTVAIYRVWNNRADSNHRYVNSIALRNQMTARGYIAEGYGPESVTLCALA